MTVVTGAWVGWLTVYAVTIVPIATYALAALLSIQADHLCVGMLVADYSITWVGDFLADKPVTGVTCVTFAVVVSCGLDIAVGNALGVDIAVVRITWVDWGACKSIAIVSGATGAEMVVDVAVDAGCTFGVGVTTPVADGTRILLDTLAAILVVAVVTSTTVTGVEVGTE